jgi:hypothetical protein
VDVGFSGNSIWIGMRWLRALDVNSGIDID